MASADQKAAHVRAEQERVRLPNALEMEMITEVRMTRHGLCTISRPSAHRPKAGWALGYICCNQHITQYPPPDLISRSLGKSKHDA
jgi:hypothetical protein